MLLPEQWEQTYLGELAALKTGPFGNTLHKSDYRTGGIPVVNPMHIVDGKIVPSSGTTIAPETAERLAEFGFSVVMLSSDGVVIWGAAPWWGKQSMVGSAALAH
jgi:hypothetical protein